MTTAFTALPRNSNPVPDLIAILRSADAQAMFGWVLPDDPGERPQLLADVYHARLPHRTVLVLVADPAGFTYGVVPVQGRPHGFTLAAPAGRAKRDFHAPGGFGRFQLRLHHLVTRLAAVADAEKLRGELTAFRGPEPGAPGVESDGVRVFPLAAPARDRPHADTNGTRATPLQNLLSTYADGTCSWVQPRGRVRPPSRRKVERVVNHILSLLLPGYFGPLPEAEGFTAFVLRRASAVQQQLVRLVRQSVAFEKAVNPLNARVPKGKRNTPEKVVWEFLEQLSGVRRMLNDDVHEAYDHDPALPVGQHHQILLAYPGLTAIAIYRIANVLHRLDVTYIPRMMTELAHRKTGIDIHPGATIGAGFFIDHGTGVTIGETCVIGQRVKLYQGVTLGALNFKRTEDGELDRGAKRHPTLEDEVEVFANASVLGNILVRRGTKIGANVSLRQDTDPESVVRLPLSLRELSISSPRLALEARPASSSVGAAGLSGASPDHRPEGDGERSKEQGGRTVGAEKPARQKCDPETGLPDELLRDEREYHGVEEYGPTSP